MVPRFIPVLGDLFPIKILESTLNLNTLVRIQRTIGVVNAEKPHKRTPVQHSENTKLSKFVDGA